MLNMFNQNISIDGHSMVKEEVIATMNMNANGAADTMNGAYFNMSISDMQKFMENKDAVMADFISFCNKAISLVADIEDGPDAD